MSTRKTHQHYTESNKLVRRSSLIFPVNVERFVEKASTRGADCLIMDLEDSVPHTEKETARNLVKESIPKVGKGGGDISVRINAPIDQATRDLEASVWPGLTCVALPKVESGEDVRIRERIITDLEKKRGIEPGTIQLAIAVETAIGVVKAYEIASSSPRIVSIGVGAEDLTQEMGVQTSKSGQELWYARSKVLMDAYAAGVQPIGLVGVEPFTWREPEKALNAAINSRNLGYKGAQSIHPAPVPYLNTGFSIPESDLTRSRKELDAFEEGLKKGIASINVDGRMIDIASAERCRKIIERFKSIEYIEKRKTEAMKNPTLVEEKLRKAIFEV
jgi:citrate lyase subunit beta/citryl-CoA lyase